jgi:hypothetical protein
MPRCTHKGCGKDYDTAHNSDGSCVYHPGAPVSRRLTRRQFYPHCKPHQVFHEGLKSWSCCSDANKPVLDFDEFMRIPVRLELSPSLTLNHCFSKQGCARGSHTDEVPKLAPPVSKGITNVVETESNHHQATFVPIQNSTPVRPAPANGAPAEVKTPSVREEEDDVTVPVDPGTICRRKGCGAAFVSDSVNRLGDGEGTVCTYHPSDVSLDPVSLNCTLRTCRVSANLPRRQQG